MIKINLLPAKEQKRRRRSPSGGGGGGGGASQNLLVLFMLVLIMELGGLVYWKMQAEASKEAIDAGQKALIDDKGKYERIKAELAQLTALETEVAKQRVVFEELAFGKVGPVNMLLYLSYVLRKVDGDGMNEDEYAVLSDLWSRPGGPGAAAAPSGVQEEWNPSKVWIESLTEANRVLTIKGDAKGHEDVMVFLRRLQSSVYFEGIDLVEQKVDITHTLGIPYVQFTLKAIVNYDPRHYPPL